MRDSQIMWGCAMSVETGNIFTLESAVPSHMSETLRVIITACLWHEPHSFPEIIAKTEMAHNTWVGSKRDLKKSICSALREAIAGGLINYNSGYYLLSVSGRVEAAKAYCLEDGVAFDPKRQHVG